MLSRPGKLLLQDRGIWGVYSSVGQQNSAELVLVQVKGSRVPAAHPHPEIPKVPPPPVHSIPDSFCAARKIIPDRASVHTQERLQRRDFCDAVKLRRADLLSGMSHVGQVRIGVHTPGGGALGNFFGGYVPPGTLPRPPPPPTGFIPYRVAICGGMKSYQVKYVPSLNQPLAVTCQRGMRVNLLKGIKKFTMPYKYE